MKDFLTSKTIYYSHKQEHSITNHLKQFKYPHHRANKKQKKIINKYFKIFFLQKKDYQFMTLYVNYAIIPKGRALARKTLFSVFLRFRACILRKSILYFLIIRKNSHKIRKD